MIERVPQFIYSGWEAALRIYQNLVIGYALALVVVFSYSELQEEGLLSLLEIDARTLVFAASVSFPLTAILYILFNLRTRFNEVLDIGLRQQWAAVYFPADPIEAGNRKLSRYLRRRFNEYYSPWELAALSLGAGATVFCIGTYVVVGLEPPGGSTLDLSDRNTWRVLATAGFFGSFVGSLTLVLRKLRTFDLYPSTYFQSTVGVVAGGGVGAASGAALPFENTLIVVLAIGFFCSIRVGFLYNLLRERLARLTGTSIPPDIPSTLDMVIRNTEAIESLNNISVNSIAELVSADPIRLYLNLAQQVGVVNSWIDRALLVHYFPSDLSSLTNAGVLAFIQLKERIDRGGAISGNAAADARICAVAADVIDCEVHDVALALLSPKYRYQRFLLPRQDLPKQGMELLSAA
jgi:hypothetical protein